MLIRRRSWWVPSLFGIAFAAACATADSSTDGNAGDHVVPVGGANSAASGNGGSDDSEGGAGGFATGTTGGTSTVNFPDGGGDAGHGGSAGHAATGGQAGTTQGLGGSQTTQGLGGNGTTQGLGGNTTTQGLGGNGSPQGTGGSPTTQGLGGASPVGVGGASQGGSVGTGGTPCVPQCAGKQCGDDTCGGTCLPGCTATQACTSGMCVDTAQPKWTSQILGSSLHGMALDPAAGGLLYVAGNQAGSGMLASVDPGTGKVLTSTNVGPTSGGLDVVHVINGALSVAGYGDFGGGDGPDGAYQTFSLGSLTAATTFTPLFGSFVFDEVLDVAADGAGNVWLTGVSGTTGSGLLGSPWGIELAGACGGFPLNPSKNAVARSVALFNGNAYVLLYQDGQGVLAQYDLIGNCGTAINSVPVMIGTVSTEPTKMVAIGGTAYIVGNADPGGGAVPFIVSYDLATLTAGTMVLDAGQTDRKWNTISTDGTQLCIGGSQGSGGYVELMSTAFVTAWPAYGALPSGTDNVLGVACGGGAVYGASNNGTISKCDGASGVCD